MKMLRKLISLVSAATLLTSSLAMTLPASAATVDENNAVASEPNIQANVQDGVILHAFNWSYNTIKQNLPQIAEAGYSTVQTSPVQQPKDYGTSTDVGGQWWKPYQPVSLSFAQASWFGTKADLTALCTEADKYGIKIIVDVVSNHLANNVESDPYSISTQVKTYEPSIYAQSSKNGSAYWHSYAQGASDGNQQSVVQGHIGMPDLNTGNTTVQNLVKNLLNDCIQCGVDGFRFDAAKHIETPSDGSYASSYWTNVLNYAKSQYKNKTGKDLYVYGEILNTPGSGRQWSWYTNFMNITDNATGNSVLGAVRSGNAGSAASSSYKTGQAANKVVLWAESHDTFMNPKDANYSASTSDDKIVKAWAMVASRKDATALYFARPGSAKMGEAAGDTTYKSTVVSEINKFHNAFVGKSEKLGSSGSYAYVNRGNTGIVIANISGNGGNVNISGTGMNNGTYTDTVTGNTFTVSGGTVSGTIGSTGVAVVYQSTSTPKATSSMESGTFRGETMTTTLNFENAVSATYCLDDSTPVAYTNGTTIRIGSDYNYGDTINLTLTATDKNGQSKEYKYSFKKEKSQSSGVYVFFDKAHSTWNTWNEPYNCYIYDEVTKAKNPTYTAGGWPGLQMEYDSKLGLYYVEVPNSSYATTSGSNPVTTSSDFDLSKSSNTCVVINGTLASGTLGQYPTDASNPANQVYLKLNGKSHIYGKNGRKSWEETNLVPTKTEVQATNVTKGKTAQPTTVAPTTAQATTQAATYGNTFKVTANSNFFPKKEATYDSTTKKLTVTYFMNCEYGLLNSQWKLSYDGTALKFNEADNTKENEDEEIISTVMPKASTAVINPKPSDMEYGIRGNCTNTRLYKLNSKGNQVAFVSVTFEVLRPVDTEVNLEIEEMALSYIPAGQTTSDSSYDQALIADSKVNDVACGYTLVTSSYEGGLNESYVNAADPKTVYTPTGQPSTQATQATQATGATQGGEPVLLGYYGDVDKDGHVTIDDVSLIQLYLNRERAKLDDLQKILADVDQDGNVTIDDVTSIQCYLASIKRKLPTEKTGDPYYGQGGQPSTQPTAGTTGTTGTTGDTFTVSATSNFFAAQQQTFDKSTKKVTVSFYINCEKDLLDAQWTLKYDGAVLKYNEANNTTTDSDENTIINVMPCTKGDAVINSNPEGMTNTLLGNYSSLSLAKLSNKTTGKVGFVTVTFDVLQPANATVDLQVEEMSISKREAGQSQSSEEEQDQLLYMSQKYDVRVPYTLTTAIYAGNYDAARNNASDPVINYTPSENPSTPAFETVEITTASPEPYTDQPYTDQPYTEPETHHDGPASFQFSDSLSWGDIHVYAWDAEGKAITAEWPGDSGIEGEMNPYNQMVYTINVPAGAVGVIVNGTGGQTANITDFNPEGGGYYVSADQTTTNEFDTVVYVPIPWGPVVDDTTYNDNPTYDDNPNSFYFSDSLSWGDIHVYAWDAEGKAITAEWPGDSGVEGEMNPYNQMVYTINVPAGAVGVIVNGTGGQTANITDFNPEGGGYYVMADQTTTNEFNAVVYVPIPWGPVVDDPTHNYDPTYNDNP
ncbi:MAG: alpha-amylase family glycosyl hydrolase, partial [Ruminococcus sp.]|nr:alpha-amylase family glycosyl hydrolase [Ruminococcus sp.]